MLGGKKLPFFELWQDEELLSEWKQQLDHDIETLKLQSNITSISSVSGDPFMLCAIVWVCICVGIYVVCSRTFH